MKKRSFSLLAVLAVVLVGATIVATQAGLLSGRFPINFWGTLDPRAFFIYKGTYVSVVTSPVTSVVVSEVTSEVTSEVASEVTSIVGTSEVTSEVVSLVTSEVTSEVASTVTSPVASPVTVPESSLTADNTKDLKALTVKILKAIARMDFETYRSRFVLSPTQSKQILELYEETQQTQEYNPDKNQKDSR